tara:strand:+ start:620 stop:817 length:198 start_codon:yes stop_codon:yes gene_type:complete
MLSVIAWVGTVCMAVAPFLIDYDIGKLLAIMGLTLLTVQATHAKLYNLILLNTIGIIGYFYALYF